MADVNLHDALDGLAEDWDADATVRSIVREKNSLVRWPSPETVGLPSMNLCFHNRLFTAFFDLAN